MVEAETAAKHAVAKQAVAEAKRDIVVRMRASDAARAASTAREPTLATAAAPTPESEAEEAAAETSALRRVAEGATVAREQGLLESIKKAQQKIEAADMLVKGRIGGSGEPSEGDKSTAYLKSKLASMLSDIEKELQSVKSNVDLKRALDRVDKNKDGVVTAEEIDQALRTIVAQSQTHEAAAALIKYLDTDKDGSIAVSQLQRFLDEYAARIVKADRAGETATVPRRAVRREEEDGSGSDTDSDRVAAAVAARGGGGETEEERKQGAAKAALSATVTPPQASSSSGGSGSGSAGETKA